MPLRSYGSFINNTVELINQVIKVAIAPADMKACHPLGPINFEGQTAVIAKLIYFDQKEKNRREKVVTTFEDRKEAKRSKTCQPGGTDETNGDLNYRN